MHLVALLLDACVMLIQRCHIGSKVATGCRHGVIRKYPLSNINHFLDRVNSICIFSMRPTTLMVSKTQIHWFANGHPFKSLIIQSIRFFHRLGSRSLDRRNGLRHATTPSLCTKNSRSASTRNEQLSIPSFNKGGTLDHRMLLTTRLGLCWAHNRTSKKGASPPLESIGLYSGTGSVEDFTDDSRSALIEAWHPASRKLDSSKTSGLTSLKLQGSISVNRESTEEPDIETDDNERPKLEAGKTKNGAKVLYKDPWAAQWASMMAYLP